MTVRRDRTCELVWRAERSEMKTIICFYLWLMLGLAVNGCVAASAQLDSSPVGVTYWPVALEATEGQIEVYQPQPEAMKGDVLTTRVAVSLTRPGAAAPVFGAAWLSAHVVTDRDTRTVTIRDLTVKDVRLPGSSATEQQDFARAIGGRLSAAQVTFPLDQLTTSLDTARREQKRGS